MRGDDALRSQPVGFGIDKRYVRFGEKGSRASVGYWRCLFLCVKLVSISFEGDIPWKELLRIEIRKNWASDDVLGLGRWMFRVALA